MGWRLQKKEMISLSYEVRKGTVNLQACTYVEARCFVKVGRFRKIKDLHAIKMTKLRRLLI